MSDRKTYGGWRTPIETLGSRVWRGVTMECGDAVSPRSTGRDRGFLSARAAHPSRDDPPCERLEWRERWRRDGCVERLNPGDGAGLSASEGPHDALPISSSMRPDLCRARDDAGSGVFASVALSVAPRRRALSATRRTFSFVPSLWRITGLCPPSFGVVMLASRQPGTLPCPACASVKGGKVIVWTRLAAVKG